MIEIAKKKLITLDDKIMVNGKRIGEVWVNNKKVYPEDSGGGEYYQYCVWLNVPEQKPLGGKHIINRIGIFVKFYLSRVFPGLRYFNPNHSDTYPYCDVQALSVYLHRGYDAKIYFRVYFKTWIDPVEYHSIFGPSMTFPYYIPSISVFLSYNNKILYDNISLLDDLVFQQYSSYRLINDYSGSTSRQYYLLVPEDIPFDVINTNHSDIASQFHSVGRSGLFWATSELHELYPHSGRQVVRVFKNLEDAQLYARDTNEFTTVYSSEYDYSSHY